MKKWQQYIRRVFVLLFFFLVSFPMMIPSAKAVQYNSANIDSVDGQVNIKKSGDANLSIKINYSYSTYLDWNLGVKSIKDLRVKGGERYLSKGEYILSRENNYLRITSLKTIFNYRWEISFRADKSIIVGQRETFKWLAVGPNHGFINSINVLLKSEVPFREDNRRTYRLYAFHGVETSQYKMVNTRTISFSGENLGSAAGFSLEASWPRGSLHFSIIKQIISSMNGLSLFFWLFFALMLPIIALTCLIILYIKNRKQISFHGVKGIRKKPPTDLSPLMVGILVDKKIYPKTIMAAILDLCQRDYLIIIKDKKQYVFGKRKVPDDNLRPWEKLLYEEMVTKKVWSKESEVKKKNNKEFFSPGMRAIYEQAYENMTNLGYFDINPHYVRMKYKIFGIFLYLLSIIGVIWVVFTMRSPYLLISIVGVLVSTMVLIKFAHLIPVQSQSGLEAKLEWIKFKNYLADRETLMSSESISGLFYEYLPYALALGAEGRWAERFHNYKMIMPSWFMSSELLEEEAENTVDEVIKVIGIISSQMSQLHGPSVR